MRPPPPEREGFSRAIACLLAVLMLLAPLSAHEVVVEQIVEMAVAAEGHQLAVRIHAPLAVLGGAPLPLAAADLAHSLDVRQGETTLAPPAVTGQAAADGASADLVLRYSIQPDGGPLSARVNAFDTAKGPVRTRVRFQTASGQTQSLSVAGPPVRTTFDPPAWDVVQQFASRGVRALTGGGDHLLMLLCLLLPLRRARAAVTLFAAGALGQTMAIAIALAQPAIHVVSGFSRTSGDADTLTAIAMIAASFVVIAALQNIVRAQWRWTVLVVFAFGALNGFTFGQTLGASEQFAGAHAGLAAAAFTLVVLAGEFWFGAVAWAARLWLDERGVPERALILIASAFVAHEAVHRVYDRGQSLAAAGTFSAEHALVWLTLGWACVMLLVAAGNALAGRTVADVQQVQTL